MTETQIHESCARTLDALLLEPAQWTCFPAGHIQLSAAQAASLQRSGLKRGWPDIQIVFEGLIFGIEVKAPGGRLSKSGFITNKRGKRRWVEGQEDIFPRLKRAGMTIAVIHSVDELIEVMRYFGLPLRATVTQPPRNAVAASPVAA